MNCNQYSLYYCNQYCILSTLLYTINASYCNHCDIVIIEYSYNNVHIVTVLSTILQGIELQMAWLTPSMAPHPEVELIEPTSVASYSAGILAPPQ